MADTIDREFVLGPGDTAAKTVLDLILKDVEQSGENRWRLVSHAISADKAKVVLTYESTD
jgi:hypothetical protein